MTFIRNLSGMKVFFLPNMEGPLKAGGRGMADGADTVPKWVLTKDVREEWEIVRAEWGIVEGEEEWVIAEAWGAGCIMAAGKVDLRNAHSLEQR